LCAADPDGAKRIAKAIAALAVDPRRCHEVGGADTTVRSA
jgi:hypothetical protein